MHQFRCYIFACLLTLQIHIWSCHLVQSWNLIYSKQVQIGKRRDVLATVSAAVRSNSEKSRDSTCASCVLHLLAHLALPPDEVIHWSCFACHVSTKDEAALTSSSEYSHGLPHCALNNVLYLIIKSGTFILYNNTGTSSNTSPGTVSLLLSSCSCTASLSQ